MQRILCAGAIAVGLLCTGQGAQAGTVTVLTSFPKELTTAYQKAFEARNPGIKVEILNKNTTAAIAYVRELAEGQRPDIMWASAPDAFEVLARNKLLQAAPDTRNPAAPAKIGNYPLNDPNGLCQYKGVYHVFCQCSPDWPATDAARGWGHFTSRVSFEGR